ncbi:MAG: Rieske 2Fe-2S domain-containing protein [Candidatus Rokubacteria bacterium]|nr:Rieske 2Fe-2S domain-containing protein [Candidatus Rokubacteria bacterium]
MRAMTPSAEWSCAASDVPPDTTATLRLVRDGRVVDAFLVHARDGYRAYVNRCPHVGTPLDLFPNEFLSDDGREIVCSTHGAIFEPATGRCLGGPCAGDRLTPLTVQRDGDRVVVRVP